MVIAGILFGINGKVEDLGSRKIEWVFNLLIFKKLLPNYSDIYFSILFGLEMTLE